jgi:crossover junction endodeoxyribonuclease RuvC
MTTVVGVDPGLSGAFAFLNIEECTIRLVDMPTFEFETNKRRVKIDPYTIVNELRAQELLHVYLEEVYASPQMGVVSAFSFGEGKGMIEGIVAGLGVPLTQVKPARWKKDMRVPADKRAACMRASQLIPGAASHFKGPRGGILDGRAEAAILALYGALELGCAPNAPVTVIG